MTSREVRSRLRHARAVDILNGLPAGSGGFHFLRGAPKWHVHCQDGPPIDGGSGIGGENPVTRLARVEFPAITKTWRDLQLSGLV